MPDKNDPQHLYNPEDFDFAVRAAIDEDRKKARGRSRHSPGPAIDAGILLPTINDDFTGKAPDLGAYELDRPIPHYGPRQWPSGPQDPNAPRSVTGPPH